MKWYYEKNDEPQGPFSLEEILPVIIPETLVWRENSLEDWIEAKNHPLLGIIFTLTNVTSPQVQKKSTVIEEVETVVIKKEVTPYEINLLLKSDWKSKGFGSKGVTYLYIDNVFLQTVALDGFDIIVNSKNVNPIIRFVEKEFHDFEMEFKDQKDLLEEWLLNFPTSIIEINLPVLDTQKKWRIDLKYGDRSPSFFGGDMGIMANPNSIQEY
jgi:hypothetical protein